MARFPRKANRYQVKRFSRTLSLALLLVATHLHALDPNRALNEYGITFWTASKTLPSENINAVLQTQDGYLWLGTNAGLVRFDGVRFTPATPSWAKAATSVRALAEDTRGVLWVGLERGGVCRSQQDAFVCFGERDGFPPGTIAGLAADKQGGIWASVVGSGAVYIHGGKFKRLGREDGLPTLNLTQVFVDSRGTIWFGTYDAGVISYSGDHFRNLRKPNLPANLTWSVAEDREGVVWVAGFGGLSRLNRSGSAVSRTYTHRDGLPSDNVSQTYLDSNGVLWCSANGGGLSRFQNGKFSTITTKEGLADASILSLINDREGNLWVGTKGGLNRLRDEAVTLISPKNSLLPDSVRVLSQSRDRRLWVGTYNAGIYSFSENLRDPYPARLPIKACSPLALYERSSTSMWIGCAGGEIVHQSAGKAAERFRLGSKNQFVEVNAITEWPPVGMVAATFGNGVENYRDGKWTPNVLVPEAHNITSLLAGEDGLWVADYERGVFLVSPDRSVESFRQQMGSAVPTKLSRDSDGSVWIITASGLLHANRTGCRPISFATAPFANDPLFNLVDDKAGSYWLSTGRGIYRLPRSYLHDLSKPMAPKQPPTLFGVLDGVRASNSVGYAEPTALRAAGGAILFASSKGLLRIDPKHIPQNRQPPPVRIEEILIDDHPLFHPGSDRYRIPASAHRLEIAFTALSLTVPEKNEFAYQLIGSDPGWISADSKRTASYTDLAPGSYTFRVKASNNDGIWNSAGSEITIEKIPFFYQTLLFRLSVTALLGTGLLWAYRRHIDQVHRNAATVELVVAREREAATQQRVAELAKANDVLRRVNSGIAQERDYHAALRLVIFENAKLIGCQDATLYRYEESKEQLRFECGCIDGALVDHIQGHPYSDPNRPTPVTKISLWGKLRPGEVFVSESIPDPQLPPSLNQWHLSRHHSLVFRTKLAVSQQPIGWLAIAFCDPAKPETTMVEAFRSMAQQATLALQLVRLGENAREGARRAATATERARIASEIHDGLQQLLLASQLWAGLLRKEVQSPVGQQALASLDMLIENAVIEARRTISALRPRDVGAGGLVEALRTLCMHTNSSSLRCSLHVHGQLQENRPHLEDQLYRICQEAISNAVKHSGAKNVTVAVTFNGSNIELEIKDDGRGVDLSSIPDGGSGLENMRNRASSCGALLDYRSQPNEGFAVRVRTSG